MSEPRELKIGLVQMMCTDNPEENIDKALQMASRAADEGAGVVCLQELFRTPYFCQREDTAFFDLAEPVPGATTTKLGRLATDRNLVIIASLFERRAPGLYHNTVAVIEPEVGVTGKYRKMHIPDDPYYYEKFYFTPGDLGFRSHRTSRGNLGVLICWDQWFPEAARLTALSGASILFYPTAIGWIDGESSEVNRAQCEAWEVIQRGHAIANGVFVAAVNRVGREGALHFWGQSFVCDPFGRVIAKASAEAEEALTASCDLALVEQTRRNWPFLRDRRVEAYEQLGELFRDCTDHESSAGD